MLLALLAVAWSWVVKEEMVVKEMVQEEEEVMQQHEEEHFHSILFVDAPSSNRSTRPFLVWQDLQVYLFDLASVP